MPEWSGLFWALLTDTSPKGHCCPGDNAWTHVPRQLQPHLPPALLQRPFLLERAAESDPVVQGKARVEALESKDAQLATRTQEPLATAGHHLSPAKKGESSGAAAKWSRSYRGKRGVLTEEHCPVRLRGCRQPRAQQVRPVQGDSRLASYAETSPELADQEEPGWPRTTLIGQTSRLPAPLSNSAVHVGRSSAPRTSPSYCWMSLSRAPRCGHHSAGVREKRCWILLNTREPLWTLHKRGAFGVQLQLKPFAPRRPTTVCKQESSGMCKSHLASCVMLLHGKREKFDIHVNNWMIKIHFNGTKDIIVGIYIILMGLRI